MDKKLLKLVQRLKRDSDGVIRDFYNGNTDLEFAKGCIISNDCLLDDIEEIWDLDLTKYRTNLNFTKNTNQYTTTQNGFIRPDYL